MSSKIKKGDVVAVISGNEKGKTGTVVRVIPKDGKVVVQGINRVFKHLKPSRQHPQGGRIQKEMPLNISNVLPVDPKTNRPTRVGFKVEKDGTKERVSRKSGDSLGTVSKTQGRK